MAIWNILLTAGLGVMGFMLKGKFDEIDRLGILLNKTREEMARDHITRAEVRADMEKVMAQIDHRFNRLEEKLDVIAGVKR
jgi:tRNA1(Val) A37 N6-methylase TrmN6